MDALSYEINLFSRCSSPLMKFEKKYLLFFPYLFEFDVGKDQGRKNIGKKEIKGKEEEDTV